ANPGLKVSGGGTLNVTGTGAVVVNSDASGALTNSGGGAITAPGGIDVTGGTSGGGTYTPAVTTGTPPTPDPYSYLPTPSQPGNGYYTSNKVGNVTTWDIYPGAYTTGGKGQLPSTFGSNDIVIFHQAINDRGTTNGIFYFVSGGITISG